MTRLAVPEIFGVHTRGKPLATDVDLAALAKRTDGLMGADIEAICRKAALLAIRAVLGEHGPEPTAQEVAGLEVSARHFEAALAELKR